MHHPRPETTEQQCRRAGQRGAVASTSAARLAAVWAEQDAEIEARLAEGPGMKHKFVCKHCGSRFSLDQEREAHEKECGKVDAPSRERNRNASATEKPCKYCGEVFTNFGEYGAHRWAAHREEVLAEVRRSREQRKTDERKIDAAIKGKPNGKGAAAPPAARTSRSASAHEPTCPTCGGALPATTAELVSELRAAGIPEPQAFAAARIARRVLSASPE